MKFVETIKIHDGKARLIAYHQARIERTVQQFFPQLAATAMPNLETVVLPEKGMSLYKARVVYGERGVENVEFAPYAMRQIASLQVVEDDAIEYPFKSIDRTRLNQLAARKGCSDEIVIVRHGFATDTSFTNLAIYDGNRWLTPRRPLLAGTKRAYLLDKGIIQEADISSDNLRNAQRIRLFNAMIEFGEMEIQGENIHF